MRVYLHMPRRVSLGYTCMLATGEQGLLAMIRQLERRLTESAWEVRMAT